MHNQRLRQQTHHEPAGLEQRLVFRGVGVEHKPHQAEGQDIEDGADRPKEQHKAPEIRRVPVLRLLDLLVVHVIKRDRYLRHVVHQVLDQQVQRQHRQERQKRARHQHAENVTEVGAGGHFDVLEHVGKGAASFDHALLQHHQTLFQQNDIRRFAGNIHRAIDGYTDVRRTQRGRVVDAVAHKAHHVPFALEQGDDALFVHRRQAGKQRGTLGKLRQLIVGQVLNIAPHHHVARVQPHFMAHFGRHQLAVAGENFDGNAARLQRLQRRRGGLFRRIEEGDIALEDQIGFVDTLIVTLARGQELARDRHHAQPLTVQVVGDAPDAAQHGVVQRHDVAVIANLRRHVEDLLQRPFADQLVHVRLLAHHHRHAAALEVERDLIHLLPAAGERAGGFFIHPFQHRDVEQVFQPGLVMAVQPRAV